MKNLNFPRFSASKFRAFPRYSFTLIEILVVATIIGLLAGGAAVTYSKFSQQSRDAKRKADLEQIKAAIEMYRSNNNSYPLSSSLTINCNTTGGITDASNNTYLSTIPKDPKCPIYSYYYSYISNGNDYTLGTYLEAVSASSCVAGQCGGNCNYCLGSYGQK